ncbi:MAG: hypothetical protein AAB443_00935 [Patescibacteria group bacterium]
MKLKKRFDLVVLILVFFVFLVPVFYQLGNDYTNVDQFLWYERSLNFYKALRNFDFANTYQKYHPGVTVMYLVGLGQLVFSKVTTFSSDYSFVPYTSFHLYNFYTKFFVTLISYLTLFMCFVLIYRYFGKLFGLSFISLLLLEPFFLANIRNLHLDTLLTSFIFASFLTCALWVKERKRGFLILSFIFCGLSLLTKSIGIFSLVLNTFVIIHSSFFFKIRKKEALIGLGSFLVGSLLLFVLLFPSMWVEPIRTVNKMLYDGVIDTGVSGGHTHYINQIRIRNPGPQFYLTVVKYRFSVYYIYLFLVSVLFLMVYGLVRRKTANQTFHFAFMALLFLVSYLLVFSYLVKKTDRYVLVIYPFTAYLIGYFFEESHILKKYVGRLVSNFLILSLFFILGFINFNQVKAVYSVFPNMFTFYSPFFGGINQAKKVLYLNSGGTGMREIAEYLNLLNLPVTTRVGYFNPETLQPWTPLRVDNLRVEEKKKYDFIIIPDQRGKEFTQGYNLVYSYRVDTLRYLRVYKRKTPSVE